MGNYFKVAPEDIRRGIEGYTPSNSRSQLIRAGTNTIVLDAYNANPSSIKLAIENFAQFPEANKILMLGAMAELGGESITEHKHIIDLIGSFNWTEVVLVGGDFLKIKHSYKSFQNSKEANEWLSSQSFEHTAFLVKGSRSMQMENAVETLYQNIK